MGSVIGRITEEAPSFKLLEKLGNYEIRQYAPTIVAEVKSKNEENAFNQLASYIFGNNLKGSESEKIAMTVPVIEQRPGLDGNSARSEKIAMTVPVIEQRESQNDSASEMIMRFVMPSKYTLDQLPKPTNDNITLKAIPEKIVAVSRFSGWITPERLRDEEQRLLEELKNSGKKPLVQANGENPISLAQYNPPWTLPWWRTNELWVELEREQQTNKSEH